MSRRRSHPFSSSPPPTPTPSGTIPISPPRLARPSQSWQSGFPSQTNGGSGATDYDSRVFNRVQAWRGDTAAGGDDPAYGSSPQDDTNYSDDSMETIIIPIKDISNLSLASRVRADSNGSQPAGLSRGRAPLATPASAALHRRGSAQLSSAPAFPSGRRSSSPGPGLNPAGPINGGPALRGRTAHPNAHAPFAGAQGITPLATDRSSGHELCAGAAGMGRHASSPRLGLHEIHPASSLSGLGGRLQAQASQPSVMGRRTVGFQVPRAGSPSGQQPGGRSSSPGAGVGRHPSMTGMHRPSLSNGWDSHGPRTPTPGSAPALSRSSSGATATPISEYNRQALDSYARSFHVGSTSKQLAGLPLVPVR